MIAQVGAPLPPWTPGTLDIHQISTGRGNAALLILPDGTTLLIDAGAAGNGLPETDPHPDASRTPGTWIARYAKRHLPEGTSQLDYAMITHFHPDHMAGIADVDSALPIRTLIDRGWPDYSYPSQLTDPAYQRFVAARKGMQRFQAGSARQIRLLNDAAKYPTFEIRNIIGNGVMWTGSGDQTKPTFPPIESLAKADIPNENMCSLGIRIQYGKFRYFTGGDLPGTPDPGFPAWHAPEAAIAPIVGPVDVHVVNQHGSMGEESEAFLEALRSTVLIVPSWAPSHPAPDVLKRIMNSRLPPSPRYVFATDLREAARIVIGQRATQLAGPAGHIVVRVTGGGAQYRVYVLDNRDERDLVVAEKGPFPSTSAGSLSDFKMLRILALKGTTYHVQGIDFDDQRIWATSVDREHRKGYLHEFSLATGELIGQAALEKGSQFHPGGFSSDDTSLWIPVAEYRANSSAVIQKRKKSNLELESEFEVPDHIGCIAVTPETVIGGNWDSKDFYVWDHRGKLIRKVVSTTGNGYQDMKFEAGQIVASGILADGTGAIDWLEYPSFRLIRRLNAGKNDRGVLFTREGMAIHGNRLALLPEDGPSRLFFFDLTGW